MCMHCLDVVTLTSNKNETDDFYLQTSFIGEQKLFHMFVNYFSKYIFMDIIKSFFLLLLNFFVSLNIVIHHKTIVDMHNINVLGLQ